MMTMIQSPTIMRVVAAQDLSYIQHREAMYSAHCLAGLRNKLQWAELIMKLATVVLQAGL